MDEQLTTISPGYDFQTPLHMLVRASKKIRYLDKVISTSSLRKGAVEHLP